MPDPAQRAQEYQKLVQQYEQLGKQIQILLREHGGHTENMSLSDMQRYRQLAEERDHIYDRIKTLEAEWLGGE